MTIDISDLGPIERQIVQDTVSRLRKGVHTYGAWNPQSKASWLPDAIEELIDTNAYMLAEMYRLKQQLILDADIIGAAV